MPEPEVPDAPVAIAFEHQVQSAATAIRPPLPAPQVSALPEVAAPVVEVCDPPEDLDVLFIGNSYTIMHDLPGLVAQLGSQAGIEVHAEMLATGGQDFEYHLARSKTVAVLGQRDWDVVVLQSHSLDPLRNPEGFHEAGKGLVELVRESGASPVLFETWARKSGHNLYNYFEPTGGSPDAMFSAVRDEYFSLADETGVEVVEVGKAWREMRKHAPELDPYASDAAHPGRLGAYLTANVFFAALTDVSPVGNVEPLMGIDPAAAALIQAQAAEVVDPPCASI